MTNENERMYELIKESFETNETLETELVKVYDTNFRNKDEVKKLIELIDYQVIIVRELIQYGLASSDDYEKVFKSLYELRVTLESVA